VNAPAERIPREQDPEKIERMMDLNAHECVTVDDWFLWLLYCQSDVRWGGVQILKTQLDLYRYFRVLGQLRPKVVIETGVQHGGSSLFFMQSMHLLYSQDPTGGPGYYVGVDLHCPLDGRVLDYQAPRTFIRGDCLAPEVVAKVVEVVGDLGPRLVVLDSVHSKVHVDEELKLYAPLCRVGDWLVVEDTDHNGRPVLADYGPAAGEAVDEFLTRSELGQKFRSQPMIEQMAGPTNSPGAWLMRVL